MSSNDFFCFFDEFQWFPNDFVYFYLFYLFPIISNVFFLFLCVSILSKLFYLILLNFILFYLILFVFCNFYSFSYWFGLIFNDSQWFPMISCIFWWVSMISNDFQWFPMILYYLILLDFNGFVWLYTHTNTHTHTHTHTHAVLPQVWSVALSVIEPHARNAELRVQLGSAHDHSAGDRIECPDHPHEVDHISSSSASWHSSDTNHAAFRAASADSDVPSAWSWNQALSVSSPPGREDFGFEAILERHRSVVKPIAH